MAERSEKNVDRCHIGGYNLQNFFLEPYTYVKKFRQSSTISFWTFLF